MIIRLCEQSQPTPDVKHARCLIFDRTPASVLRRGRYRSLARAGGERRVSATRSIAPWSNRTGACGTTTAWLNTLGATDAEGLHGLVWNRDFELTSVGGAANQCEDSYASDCDIAAPNVGASAVPDSEELSWADPGLVRLRLNSRARSASSSPHATTPGARCSRRFERHQRPCRVASVDQARLWLGRDAQDCDG